MLKREIMFVSVSTMSHLRVAQQAIISLMCLFALVDTINHPVLPWFRAVPIIQLTIRLSTSIYSSTTKQIDKIAGNLIIF